MPAPTRRTLELQALERAPTYSSRADPRPLGRFSARSVSAFAKQVDVYLEALECGASPSLARPLLLKLLRFDPLLRLHPLVPALRIPLASPLAPWQRRVRSASEEEEFLDRCRRLRESLILTNGGDKC